MKRTRKTDGGDKVCELSPFKTENTKPNSVSPVSD